MLRSIKQLYGDELRATDGEIGHIKDFYFDDQNWAVRYVVVDTGSWLSGQFSYIVAGSTESAYAAMTGLSSLGDYFLYFLLPTLVGNTIGGVTLVSLLNHGSVAPEIHKKS
jgi:hypothetical protein